MATETSPQGESDHLLTSRDPNAIERCMNLLTDVLKMVVKGTLDPKEVGDVLQVVKFDPRGFFKRLFPNGRGIRSITFKPAEEKRIGAAEANDLRQLAEWDKFYREVYGIQNSGLITVPCVAEGEMVFPYPAVRFPSHRAGFNWILPMIRGLTWDHIVDEGSEAFNISPRDFMEWVRAIAHDDRDPDRDGAYVLRLRDRVEADEELKGLSASMLWAQNMKGCTAKEHILLGRWFQWKTNGKHLDTSTTTLCSGSRSSGGRVPNVDWNPVNGRLRVGWHHPDDRDGILRTRQVVSASA